MLPTFVIGLREGLEASLIVGIVLAFLKRHGRPDLVRWALLGVGLSVALCAAGGIGLFVLSADLPQRQQEGLETVVGVIAVAMVTYMVVWMKRHSRDLKKQLEGVAGTALAEGSAWALVGMAFLAVLREGFETAVFLVAAFNGSTNRGSASTGAVLGIALAVALGYGIYRGGVRINLSRFFRVTGFVLVLVAAGLVQTAFRTAHEAGWLDVGQQATVDLSAVVAPGSVQSALITGILGIQPQPRLIEFVAWLLYLVPLALYVVWPQGRGLALRTVGGLVAAAAVVTGLVAGALAVWAPAAPTTTSSLAAAAAVGDTAVPVSVAVAGGRVQVTALDPVSGQAGPVTTLPATVSGTGSVSGLPVTLLQASFPATTNSATLTYDQIAERNGGRLPLGVRAAGSPATGSAPTTVTEQVTVTVAVATATGQVVDARWSAAETLAVDGANGTVTVSPSDPVEAALTTDASAAAVARAASAADAASSRADSRAAAGLLAVVAGLLLVVALALVALDRRRRPRAAPTAAATAGSAPGRPATPDPAGDAATPDADRPAATVTT